MWCEKPTEKVAHQQTKHEKYSFVIINEIEKLIYDQLVLWPTEIT